MHTIKQKCICLHKLVNTCPICFHSFLHASVCHCLSPYLYPVLNQARFVTLIPPSLCFYIFSLCLSMLPYPLSLSLSLSLSLFLSLSMGFCASANCIPQCQNGGMCLRPQLCVCKPGSKGKACEQKTSSTSTFPGLPGNGHNGGHNVVPQRPIPQQASPQGYGHAPPPLSNVAQMRLTQMVRPQYIQQQ